MSPFGTHGAADGIRAVPGCQEVEVDATLITGTVTFPDVSPEGNRWVDAGSVSMLLHSVLSELANRHGALLTEASLSVDFHTPTPRNRELFIAAQAVPTDANELCLHASISDSTHILVEARACFVSS